MLGSEMPFVKWFVSFLGTFSCRSPLAVENVGPHESVVNSGWVEGCEPSDAKKKGPKEKEKTPRRRAEQPVGVVVLYGCLSGWFLVPVCREKGSFLGGKSEA